ncbi:uncharacterized protein MONOS_11245 [Monocercomonoides exilis]|uniref:uncharacterized protein n=1 Tax=Monocercomonoides exilis TaxID=2049356 RepID=UPI0035595DFC|nr:hypothetical protein MONOS_11245 [Monocercomonoides exilis]|eukprot:MONOS_11245.1-p1 / transcript=MONOS_11245.1 / gene=MONOS_11245 / organism=Monocercomonoides_exilis_PA203 / gene_product=unspecified product / transcript_product=unspecified product / location=Mono_scaffold00554:3130-4179(-) / protein_length=350 / sequence_SO=supercontig / SO=protein_coding / is_pseudo=false
MGASRLFSHEEDGENEPIIDETLLELETFHGISFSFVSDEKSPYDSYKDIVKERARKFFGKEEVERCLMERFVNNGSKKLIEENEDLKIIAENKMESINKKKKEGQKKTYFYSIAARVARVYIKDQLYVQGKSPVEVANNFCRLEEKSTSKAPIHNRKRYTENETNETPYEKRKKEREHLMKDRKRNEKNNLRRIRWTKNDDTKLIAMFNEGKKTKEMMKAFPYRDRQHIDDHLQVLLEKGKIKRPDSIPLSEMIENIERKKDEPKKKRSYRRKKHVPDFGESDSQEEKPTKRKRSDEEKEEDDSLEEFELEIIMRKLKNTKSKRLKRSEDGSEWVRVEENEIEDEESL